MLEAKGLRVNSYKTFDKMYCSLVVKNDVSYILRHGYATEFCTKGEKL
jgi:hypothetical protein